MNIRKLLLIIAFTGIVGNLSAMNFTTEVFDKTVHQNILENLKSNPESFSRYSIPYEGKFYRLKNYEYKPDGAIKYTLQNRHIRFFNTFDWAKDVIVFQGTSDSGKTYYERRYKYNNIIRDIFLLAIPITFLSWVFKKTQILGSLAQVAIKK